MSSICVKTLGILFGNEIANQNVEFCIHTGGPLLTNDALLDLFGTLKLAILTLVMNRLTLVLY